MNPTVPAVLAAVAALVRDDAGPSLGDSYVGQQLLRGVALLESAAEEFDRAVARRVAENAAMRALFATAAPVVAASRGADGAEDRLAAELATAAAGVDADLRVSALDASNHVLRGLLVNLHAWCERCDAPAARALEAAVWTELRASTERRRLAMSRF